MHLEQMTMDQELLLDGKKIMSKRSYTIIFVAVGENKVFMAQDICKKC
jgi:hypothetical protein